MSLVRHPPSEAEEPRRSPLRPSAFRIDGDDDLLLVRLLMGAQPTLLMLAAAEARIFDCIAEGAFSATEIAHAAGLDSRATQLVLDGLVGLGLLFKQGGRYSNTTTSLHHLRMDTVDSHAVRLWVSGTRLWERLPEILRTGELPAVDGEVEPWRRDGDENRAFIRSMYDLGWLSAQSVAESLDLSDVSHFIDLGGGPGHYTIAVLERSRSLRATLLDLPLTLSVARDSFERRGLGERVELVACDLYDTETDFPVAPEVAELVLISHVLHMEGAQQNASLIQMAARLVRPGGRLLIHDMFLEEDRAHPQAGSLFAVHMLAMTRRGRLYTVSEICAWLVDAGLRPRLLSTSPFLIEGLREAERSRV